MSEEEKAELTELYENSEWWHNRFKAVQRDYENLQQRIDKAIEYIKSHSPSDIGICGNKKKYYYTLGEDSVDNLLEILGDKE